MVAVLVKRFQSEREEVDAGGREEGGREGGERREGRGRGDV